MPTSPSQAALQDTVNNFATALLELLSAKSVDTEYFESFSEVPPQDQAALRKWAAELEDPILQPDAKEAENDFYVCTYTNLLDEQKSFTVAALDADTGSAVVLIDSGKVLGWGAVGGEN